MVGGDHDGRGRQHRVQQPDPPPPAGAAHHQDDGQQQRPADVQARHRGVLVGQAGERGAVVHARPRALTGVDHAGGREQPGRRHRQHDVDDHGDPGDRHQRVLGPAVAGAVVDEEPDQHADRHREVQQVVAVGQADEVVHLEGLRLEECLVGQGQGRLQVEHGPGVVVGGGHPAGRDQPAEVVGAEQDEDRDQLQEGRHQPPGRRPWSGARGAAAGGHAHGDNRRWRTWSAATGMTPVGPRDVPPSLAGGRLRDVVTDQ